MTRLITGVNDLATTHPDIAAQAYGWDPTTVTAGSRKKLAWKCANGHVWPALVASRTSKNSGCRYCSGRFVMKGFNDLESTHPEIAAQAYGWDPTKFTAGSNKTLNWKCKENNKHIWSAQINTLTKNYVKNGRNGCPYCYNKLILVGDNDLATTHPDIAAQAYGWDPTTVTAGSDKVLEWRCLINANHIWPAKVQHRTRSIDPTNCGVCDGRFVLKGVNDLATTHPDIAAQANGWDPTTVTAGSKKVVSWKCKEGHIWPTRVSGRTINLSDCPSCSKSGFDPNQKGYIYFAVHELKGLLQIGITNSPERRTSLHLTRGWSILEVRGPMDGLLAQNWETHILRMLKQKNISLVPKLETHAVNSKGGEAWQITDLNPKSIKELMELTEQFEGDTD